MALGAENGLAAAADGSETRRFSVYQVMPDSTASLDPSLVSIRVRTYICIRAYCRSYCLDFDPHFVGIQEFHTVQK
jgi:hypothetical protein